MSSVTATRTNPPRESSIPRWVRSMALVVFVAVVAVAASRFIKGPQLVARVTFVNPSPYALDIEIAGANRDGWLLLGTVQPGSSTDVNQVVDQGATWVFRVDAEGVPGGDFAMSRRTLAQASWRVAIPPAVIARLGLLHATTPPAPNF
jgi:hypothetical protein